MQEENLKEASIITESELSSAKGQLFLVRDLIRCALLELERATQVIQNLSTLKDTLVCKSPKKQSKEGICMCGGKPGRDYQLTQDRVKIAEDFWASFKSEE